MKNILIVTPFFVPAYSYGWIVRVAYEQAKWLVARWYNVTVITTDVFDSKQRNSILNETIEWIKIKRFKNISNHLAKFQNLYLPIWMKKWLKNNISNYDIVHIHDIYNLCTYWAWKYALENNKKYFIQPHGTLSDIRIQSRKSFIKKWILKKMKTIFDNANWWFALTKTEIQEIENITDNTNIQELPNGIDTKKFENIKKADIHKMYNLDKNIKIITFLWRIQYIKWLDISFNILTKLDETFKNWRFLVIWPDEWEKDKLIKLSKDLWIEDKIIWYWEENTDKKYELLAWSDLFLFNSRNEGFWMTIIEACMSQIPIIISTWCPIYDIENYNIWYKIDNSNTINFVDKIKDILTNKWSYQKNLKKYVYDNYELKILNDKLINYYEK